MDAIELYQEPILNNPIMVAAWPGISNVALKAASYLRDKLGAEETKGLDLPKLLSAQFIPEIACRF